MKTAIIYASRKGFSKSIAESIAGQLTGDVSVLDIRRKPDISGFDRVVLGGSVVAGEIRQGMKKYALKHEKELLTKKLALFVCCIEQKPENIKKYVDTTFPGSIIKHAIVVEQVGGSYVPEKENFVIRFFFGKMGMKGYNLIKEDAIKRLVDALKEQ
jgi:menaquinone-dependent protoporphyrinogen oxidase